MRSFLTLRLESSISQNMRQIFQSGFFLFFELESSFLKHKKFFLKSSVFWNIRKAFLRKYVNFFNLRARKFHFSKYQDFFNLVARKFYLLKYKKSFRDGFFLFFWAWSQKCTRWLHNTLLMICHWSYSILGIINWNIYILECIFMKFTFSNKQSHWEASVVFFEQVYYVSFKIF